MPLPHLALWVWQSVAWGETASLWQGRGQISLLPIPHTWAWGQPRTLLSSNQNPN